MIFHPRISSKRCGSRRYACGFKCLLSIVALMFSLFECASLSAQTDAAAKASQLMQSGNFRDAEMLWRQLAARYPRNAEVHGNLGVCLAQQGKLQQAAAAYRKSLEIKPDQTEVRY